MFRHKYINHILHIQFHLADVILDADLRFFGVSKLRDQTIIDFGLLSLELVAHFFHASVLCEGGGVFVGCGLA